jgi:hypothetical protein
MMMMLMMLLMMVMIMMVMIDENMYDNRENKII